MTLGFKPGVYPVSSSVFARWAVYAGLHLWLVYLVLPYLRGNNWIKVYLRVAGAKVGRGAFLNTQHFYDPYLLDIGNDVVIGGEATLTCHLFEGGRLHLGKIILGENTAIGAHAYLTPGTTTGKNSKIGMNTFLSRNATIRNGETYVSQPSMNLRQAVRLMRQKGARE
jgi:acetyltransferase-like isoleucine patch superfamily enzyme